jgi:hypothetical protein
MDKETLSNYGWIVICVLVMVVMIALATPFGSFVSEAVKSTTQGFFDVNQNALNSTGLINIDDQCFDGVETNHGLYYGEAYTGTMDGAMVKAIFNEDTSAQLYINGNLETDIPAGLITYTKETVDMTTIGYGIGSISADGKTINIDGLILTLTKSVNIEEVAGKRYKLVESMGTLIFTEDKSIETYDLGGYLYEKIEAEDIQWDGNRFTVSNLPEELSDMELYIFEICNEGQYIKMIYQDYDNSIHEGLFAFDETYKCTHMRDQGNGLIDSKTYWLNVHDENGKYIDYQFSEIDSIEQMKNYSMVCSLCGETTDFYIEGNYIYLKNHQLEPQIVNGERISGTCIDSFVSDYLGWHAIPYDIAKTDGMLQTVNGEAITVAYMYPNVSLPNTIVALYGIYDWHLFENATEPIDYYIEYAGTMEQFAQIKSFYDYYNRTALEVLHSTAEKYNTIQSCVIHCSDGNITIK